MALVPSAITGAILLAGKGLFTGPFVFDRIATAMGNSVVAWAPIKSNVALQGATTGTGGTGAVTGKASVSSGVPLMNSALKESGFAGPPAINLATAIGGGLSASLNASLQYVGVSIGVGTGGDVSAAISTNPTTLIPIILANFTAVGIAGPLNKQLATGLAQGTSRIFLTAKGIGGVAGIPTPSFAVGTSTSTVF